jgi:hypothetical protein
MVSHIYVHHPSGTLGEAHVPSYLLRADKSGTSPKLLSDATHLRVPCARRSVRTGCGTSGAGPGRRPCRSRGARRPWFTNPMTMTMMMMMMIRTFVSLARGALCVLVAEHLGQAPDVVLVGDQEREGLGRVEHVVRELRPQLRQLQLDRLRAARRTGWRVTRQDRRR